MHTARLRLISLQPIPGKLSPKLCAVTLEETTRKKKHWSCMCRLFAEGFVLWIHRVFCFSGMWLAATETCAFSNAKVAISGNTAWENICMFRVDFRKHRELINLCSENKVAFFTGIKSCSEYKISLELSHFQSVFWEALSCSEYKVAISGNASRLTNSCFPTSYYQWKLYIFSHSCCSVANLSLTMRRRSRHWLLVGMTFTLLLLTIGIFASASGECIVS